MTHLVEEVELRDVGDFCVQQLIGNVENPLLDGQLDKREAAVKKQVALKQVQDHVTVI